MALHVSGPGSFLERLTNIPTDATLSFWFRQSTLGVFASPIFYANTNSANRNGGVQNTLSAPFNDIDLWTFDSTNSYQAVTEPFNGLWVWCALQNNRATQEQSLWFRLEGQPTITGPLVNTVDASGEPPPTGYDQLLIFHSAFADSPSDADMCFYKEFSGILSKAQMLVESTQELPVNGSINCYMSMLLASTIGQDTSGNGNNWTVNGASLALTGAVPSIHVPEQTDLFFGSGA